MSRRTPQIDDATKQSIRASVVAMSVWTGPAAPIHAKANELLETDGRLPIAHMTPHTLRRAFASILAICNVPPRRATYLLGHTDLTLTLSVYQQALERFTEG